MRGPREGRSFAEEDREVRPGAYGWRILLRFKGFLRPLAPLMVLAGLLSVGSALLDLVGPHLVQRIVDQAVSEGNPAGAQRTLYLWLAVVLGAFVLNVGIRLLVTWIGQSAMLAMRQEIFSHLQGLHVGYFERNPVGRILTRVMNDVAAFNELLSMGIPTFFRDVLLLGGIVLALFLTDWRLALVTAVCFPLVAGVGWAFSRSIRVFYRRTRKRLAALNAFMQENLSGMAVVQLFGREETQKEKFREKGALLRDSQLGTVLVFALLFPALEVVTALGIALILWYGGLRLMEGTLSLGVLTAFLLYLKRFVLPIRDLAEKFNMVESALAAAERISALLETRPQVADPPAPRRPSPGKAAVELENVWFAYQGEQWVLRDVSFRVERGETVAVVGPTGAGKSTLVNLLLRFYDPQRGRVLVDGVDVREWAQADLRRRFGVVLQDVFLFRGTLADNIRLGVPGLSLEEVRRAARTVHADSFIQALPGGYEHRIMESGSTLSVGQKQLLSFARALAVSPEILVLDEATSSIDAGTEALIQDALARLLRGRTALVIAHRLSTIREADRILVFQGGRIAEEGTHGELLAEDGLYAELCRLQELR